LRANEHDWAEGLFTELGGACTTLVAAQRMNLSVATLGMLGDDAYGRDVLQMLAGEGIDVRHVSVLQGRQTILCVVVTDKAGQHVFLGIKDGEPPARCPAEWRDIITQTRSIFTNGYTLRDLLEPRDVFKLLNLGRARNIPIFFDPGPSIEFLDEATLTGALALCDVLLLTGDEARFVVQAEGPAAARELLAYGPRAVVIKAGSNGCYVATEDATLHHPGFDVPGVDTVGAGDAFVSAFIAGYLQGADWLA
jgi:sugar/nucleoside kinase (ribokinase family)